MSKPQISTVKIRVLDDTFETVVCEQLSEDTYKLLETPALSCRINYGTTIKVRLDERDELEMVRVIRASEYKTRRFILPVLSKDQLIEKLGNPVLDAGGYWEVVMVGIIFIHMPRASSFDVDALISSVGNVTEMTDDI
jgi:hypothetical protein